MSVSSEFTRIDQDTLALVLDFFAQNRVDKISDRDIGRYLQRQRSPNHRNALDALKSAFTKLQNFLVAHRDLFRFRKDPVKIDGNIVQLLEGGSERRHVYDKEEEWRGMWAEEEEQLDDQDAASVRTPRAVFDEDSSDTDEAFDTAVSAGGEEERDCSLDSSHESLSSIASSTTSTAISREAVSEFTGAALSEKHFKSLKVAELRSELLARGLPHDGKKTELLQRLLQASRGSE